MPADAKGEATDMAVRTILKMGDPRLLRVAEPVLRFDTRELHELLVDMTDTMVAANDAGLAAPQIGTNLQVVIDEDARPDEVGLRERAVPRMGPAVTRRPKSHPAVKQCCRRQRRFRSLR